MGKARYHCREVGGAILCGMAPTAANRAAAEDFRRYRAGEMSDAERAAFIGQGAAPASDLGRLARVLEISAGRGTVREAREASGLKLGQAARVLGWPKERLLALEFGATMTDAERAALCEAYDVAGFVDAPATEVRDG